MEKLSSKNIEDYVKLASSDEPVEDSEFSDLNFVSKMVKSGLAIKSGRFYERTEKGRQHYNNVLEKISDYFENNMNSN